MLPAILNDNGIVLIYNFKSFNIERTSPSYVEVVSAWKNDDNEKLSELLEPKKAIEKIVNEALQPSDDEEGVTIRDNAICYNGEVLHNSLSDRIMDFYTQKLPTEGLILFLQNLMKNPSFNSRKQLYDFLDHKGLPITEDGCFLAYKGITSDWKDKHTKTVDNSIGQVVQMNRTEVDDNPSNHCSNGYHAGSMEYVSGFVDGANDIIVMVKINPKDVVSVPSDHNYTKLRTCKYEVMCKYEGEILKPLVNSYEPYCYTDNGENNDGWDEDETDDDGWDEEEYDGYEDDLSYSKQSTEELAENCYDFSEKTSVIDDFIILVRDWLEKNEVTIAHLAGLSGMSRQRLSDGLNYKNRSRKAVTEDEKKELMRAMAYIERS